MLLLPGVVDATQTARRPGEEAPMMRLPIKRPFSDPVRRSFSRLYRALSAVGRRAAWPVFTALVLMILMACSVTAGSFGPGQPTDIKPRVEPTSTHVISKTQYFPYFPDARYALETLYGDMTLACPSTEVVIHGGFWFEQSRTLRAGSHLYASESYPTNDNSWKIAFEYVTPTTVTIYAVCLVNPHATVSIVSETVTAQKNQTVRNGAQCLPGATVLGGGFKSGGPFSPGPFDMYPKGPTVWWGDFIGGLATGSATLYAVCYSRNLSVRLPTDSAIQSATAGTAPLIDYTAEMMGRCPSGTTLIVGGFQRPGFGVVDPYAVGAIDALYTNAPSLDGTVWTVRLSNTKAPVTVSGFHTILNCVTF